MMTQARKIATKFDVHSSIYISQCVIAGAHFLAYRYYKNMNPELASDLGTLVSLLGFVVPLLLSDLEVFSTALPSTYASALALPGALECIELVMAIMWMTLAVDWLIAYPDPVAQTIVAQAAPAAVSGLSFASWIVWTLSFTL
ncbi:hypothetical protein DSO57_1003073 [Entomophthora muscae]|uniref:Uncharacterized protein n=1 Tax=Entomophthora muscae TaxID=34485 RepID=A0ACC2UIQ3_9FUNG|nr:hypothetical protein DSO57_1003073 [Entomophthora muscae]